MVLEFIVFGMAMKTNLLTLFASMKKPYARRRLFSGHLLGFQAREKELENHQWIGCIFGVVK